MLEMFPYRDSDYQFMQITRVDRSWTEIWMSAGRTAAVTRAERARHWLPGPDLYMTPCANLPCCVCFYNSTVICVLCANPSGSQPFFAFMLSLIMSSFCSPSLPSLLGYYSPFFSPWPIFVHFCYHPLEFVWQATFVIGIVFPGTVVHITFHISCLVHVTILLLFKIGNLKATLKFNHSFCPLTDFTTNLFSNVAY